MKASLQPGLLVVALLTLQGCKAKVNILQGIDLAQGQTLALDAPIELVLRGIGRCDAIDVDWGDGYTQLASNTYGSSSWIDLSGTSSFAIASRTIKHTFSGWGGGKTVTVQGYGCMGKVNIRFNVPPFEQRFAFAQPGRTICTEPAPPPPDLIPRMLVHIQTVPLEPPSDRGINFGCFAAGCVYDADGRPGSVAAPPYPFVGLREFSLVLRVRSQVVQGGTNMRFTTTVSGPLEFCLNDVDNDATNNLGGYIVKLSVDQLGPSP